MASKVVKLFYNKMCPFAQRVWITALEKKAPVEMVHIPLDGPAAVPMLQVDETLISESNLISQYLDDTVDPAHTLFPGSAYDKHRIRFFMEQVSEYVSYGFEFLKDPHGDGKKADFEWNVNNIEKLLAEQSPHGPYFLGDAFTLADIALVPFLDRFAAALGAYCQFDIFDKAPRTKLLYDAAMRRPSVFQTAQTSFHYIQSYQNWAKQPAAVQPHKLYSSPICPYAERARLAAALKQAPVEIIDIDLNNKPAWYEKDVNPRGTVPALVVPGGKIVHESNLIVDYFDEAFPDLGPQLVPTGMARYRVSFFLDKAGAFTSSMWQFLLNKADAQKLVVLKENSTVVERLLTQQSVGPFFLGAEPCVGDIALVTQLVRLEAGLSEFGGGYTAFFDEFPRIAALLKAAQAHPVMGSILRDKPFYLEVVRRRVQGTH